LATCIALADICDLLVQVVDRDLQETCQPPACALVQSHHLGHGAVDVFRKRDELDRDLKLALDLHRGNELLDRIDVRRLEHRLRHPRPLIGGRNRPVGAADAGVDALLQLFADPERGAEDADLFEDVRIGPDRMHQDLARGGDLDLGVRRHLDRREIGTEDALLRAVHEEAIARDREIAPPVQRDVAIPRIDEEIAVAEDRDIPHPVGLADGSLPAREGGRAFLEREAARARRAVEIEVEGAPLVGHVAPEARHGHVREVVRDLRARVVEVLDRVQRRVDHAVHEGGPPSDIRHHWRMLMIVWLRLVVVSIALAEA